MIANGFGHHILKPQETQTQRETRTEDRRGENLRDVFPPSLLPSFERKGEGEGRRKGALILGFWPRSI